MKMTTKIVAVLLTVISAVTFANATDVSTGESTLNVVSGVESGSFKLIYQGEDGPVSLRLIDAKGEVLVSEEIKTEKGFIQPINLSQLPKGKYTVQVRSNSETLTEKVEFLAKRDRN